MPDYQQDQGEPVTPYTMGSVARDAGSLAAWSVPFMLPGHLSEAYRAPAVGATVGDRLRSVGRGFTTASGLKSFGGRVLSDAWRFFKASPKFGIMLGLPIGALGAYAGLRSRGDQTNLGSVVGEMGRNMEEEGKQFGREIAPGITGAAASAFRGFTNPIAGLSYLYNRSRLNSENA